jgi:hypothetical protein
MRLIQACVIAGAASLLVGVPAASAAPALSIKPKKREILFGKSTRITGHLGGTSPSGKRIELQKNPYPYNGFQHLATKSPDSNGNYSFSVRPDRNTRYRAVLVGTSSKSGQRAIYVDGVGTLTVRTSKSNHAIAKMTFSFSPQLDTNLFVGVALHWYLRIDRKGASKKFHRIRTNKTRRLAEGKIGGSLNYKLPSSVGKSKYTIKYCFQPKKKGDVGVGVPGKAFKKCP